MKKLLKALALCLFFSMPMATWAMDPGAQNPGSQAAEPKSNGAAWASVFALVGVAGFFAWYIYKTEKRRNKDKKQVLQSFIDRVFNWLEGKESTLPSTTTGQHSDPKPASTPNPKPKNPTSQPQTPPHDPAHNHEEDAQASAHIKVEDVEPDTCTICLETLGQSGNGETVSLGCNHQFCEGCIAEWQQPCPVCKGSAKTLGEPCPKGCTVKSQQQKNTCPICRKKITTPKSKNKNGKKKKGILVFT